MMDSDIDNSQLSSPSRRDAIKMVGFFGGALSLRADTLAQALRSGETIRLGLIADLHGGLATDAEQRLDAFLKAMKDSSCDALVQLGDFAYPNEKHQRFADKFNKAHRETIHVIGNHEFDFGLTRENCYSAWGINNSFYRRDIGPIRLLVLDGNDQGSPDHRGGYPSYIGPKQQRWLEGELKRSDKPIIILCHQPLAGASAIDNAPSIQALLGRYKSKVLLCLNGHSHLDSLVQAEGVPHLHVNSASYFWVGGKTRMAYYDKPLFTVLTVDPKHATIDVSGSRSTWRTVTPEALGYFKDRQSPTQTTVTPQIRQRRLSRSELKVMTWNIWGRLNQDPRYTIDDLTARERMIAIVNESQADVVAMIETYGSAADIAKALDLNYYTTAADANLCIFSRYPISEAQPPSGLNPFSFIAATITLPGGQKVRLHNIWLTSGGRHIVSIKDQAITDEAFTRGDDLRFDHLRQLLDHPVFKRDKANADNTPLIVAGDFNCVSHLDHTETTRRRKLNHERILPIKTSLAMAQEGFLDSYRATNPNISSDTLGHTWTTVGKDYRYESGQGFVPTTAHPQPQYQDPYARIDYIYSLGRGIRPTASTTLTRHPAYPDKQFPEFPSDHAAVVTTFRIE